MNKEKQEENKKVFDHYEINILKDNDIIDNFTIEYGNKSFMYEKKQYNIDDKMIYFMPSFIDKESVYIPNLFYIFNNPNPMNIKNNNIGIPARALYLLWNHSLYSVIVTFETDRINKIIILLLAINGIMLGINLYMMFNGN